MAPHASLFEAEHMWTTTVCLADIARHFYWDVWLALRSQFLYGIIHTSVLFQALGPYTHNTHNTHTKNT